MKRGSLFWGVILLFAGILFLLENLGLINVIVWKIIGPIFLILLGVWIIVSRNIRSRNQDQFVSIPLESASKVKFHVTHGAGRLIVSGETDPGFGLQGTFSGGVDYRTQHNGDILEVYLKAPNLDFPIFMSLESALNWSFGVIKDLPISLKFDTGADDAQIDLRDNIVSDIELKTGASLTEITLPAHAGFTQVDIHSGAASLIVHIPEGVAANIDVKGGLSSTQIDKARFPRSGQGYRSPDYDTANNKANIKIDMGVGSVVID